MVLITVTRSPMTARRILPAIRKSSASCARRFSPRSSAAFEKRTELKAYYYGNFNRDHSQWTTYPAEARYGTTYVGLRNRLSVLSEAYSYAPYKTRVLATRDFVRECVETAVKHKAEITKLLDRGPAAAAAAGSSPGSRPSRWRSGRRLKSAGEPVTVLGYVETQENGRRKKTDTTKDYKLQLMNEFEPAVERDAGRLPTWCRPTFPQAIEVIKRHGLEVQELREDLELDVEVYRLDKVERSPRRFEGHQAVELAAALAPRVADDQGRKLCGADGPAAGGPRGLSSRAGFRGRPGHLEFLRRRVERGKRLPGRSAATAGTDVSQPGRAPSRRPRTDPADHVRFRRRRWAARGGGGGGGFFGRQVWLDDEHWLQIRDGKLLKVHAATGRTQPFVDSKALAKSLARLPSLDADTAQSIAGQMSFDMDPKHRGFLFEHAQDLYYASFDLATAVRLTNQPGREQFPKFSPDGKSVAFVRDFDLYSVDIASQSRASFDHRRPRRPAARPLGLGVLRGDLEPALAGVLVEPRLEAACVHGI